MPQDAMLFQMNPLVLVGGEGGSYRLYLRRFMVWYVDVVRANQKGYWKSYHPTIP